MKNFDYFNKFCSKLIVIESTNGTKHFGVLKEVVSDGIVIQHSGINKNIYFFEIKKLEYKKIVFSNPSKVFSEKIFDSFSTKIIEEIKNEKNYKLVTRSAIFDKKKCKIKKNKQSSKNFELLVYTWLKNRKDVTNICPLALINQKYLLCIYEGIFCLIEKNYKIVFQSEMVSIVDLIFSTNKELLEFREKELNSTFKGILDLL